MTHSILSRPRHPVAGARRFPWNVSVLLIALWAAACESPVAPAACGPLPQVTVNVGETSSVAACFNDANGDMLSYTAASSNPAVATASISGTSITIGGVAPGNTTVTVTASDPQGLQGQSSFAVMVPNRAPQPRGTPPNVTVRIGATAMVDAAQYFSDPDGEALTYAASASDGAVASVTVAGSTITVTAEAKGSATVTITATDPGGLSATQSFRFTVPNRPPAPVGALQPLTVEVGQLATLDVAAFFSDPDGDALTYTAASSIPAVARTSVSGSVVTITAQGPGTATVTVAASDDERAAAIQQVSVTVPQPNRAPRGVGSIPAQTIAVGERVTVNASPYFSDPDGDALTYAASSSNGGVAGVAVSGSTVTITAVATGSATITVTAMDPGGLSATQTARVTVSRSNSAPQRVGSIPAQSLAPGSTGRIDASRYFRDPDGDALTYTATSSSSSVVRASISGSTVTITAVSSGSATITVTARDPGGLSATQTARVTVESAGAPDLEVPSVTPTSANVSPNELIEFAFTIRNRGTVASPATIVREMRSADANISTSDREIGKRNLSAKAPGETISLNWLLRIREPGTYYFGMCIDAVAGESNTQNNCSPAFKVTIKGSGGGPDLVVSLSKSSVTVAPGGSFSYDVTVRNEGDAVAAATRIRTFVSADATISTNDTQIGEGGVPSLNPSAEASRSLTIEIGANVPAETVYVGNCIDAVPGESNTGNNCSSAITVTIQTGGGSAPDLVVQSPAVDDDTPDAGASFRFSATVRNRGEGQSGATTLRYYRSSNATISSSDTEVGTDRVDALRAGGSSPETIALTAPSEGGTYYFGACVDSVDGESNTNNNCSDGVEVEVSGGGGGTHSDRDILEILYNATDGPNWRDNTNWLTDEALDQWYGVSTDASGRVVGLDLSGRYDGGEWIRHGLNGEIPPEIGNLAELEELTLNANNLSGSIPPELGGLANLEVLFLAANDLSGSIPSEIGNLANLEMLNLGGNALSGSIPPELGNLANLERLYLNSSNLSGSIPSELGSLASLVEMQLIDNRLSGSIPPEFGNLAELTNLLLQFNNLNGPIPPELGNLGNLQALDVRANDLSGSIPPELGGVASLRGLHLAFNNLSGSIPPELGSLSRLRWLDINDNPLAGPLPLELSKLPLERFRYHNTDLCVPADESFRTWLNAIRERRGTGVDCAQTL